MPSSMTTIIDPNNDNIQLRNNYYISQQNNLQMGYTLFQDPLTIAYNDRIEIHNVNGNNKLDIKISDHNIHQRVLLPITMQQPRLEKIIHHLQDVNKGKHAHIRTVTTSIPAGKNGSITIVCTVTINEHHLQSAYSLTLYSDDGQLLQKPITYSIAAYILKNSNVPQNITDVYNNIYKVITLINDFSEILPANDITSILGADPFIPIVEYDNTVVYKKINANSTANDTIEDILQNYFFAMDRKNIITYTLTNPQDLLKLRILHDLIAGTSTVRIENNIIYTKTKEYTLICIDKDEAIGLRSLATSISLAATMKEYIILKYVNGMWAVIPELAKNYKTKLQDLLKFGTTVNQLVDDNDDYINDTIIDTLHSTWLTMDGTLL